MTATTIAGHAALVGLIAAAATGTAWWMVPEAFPALGGPPRPFVSAAPAEPRPASRPESRTMPAASAAAVSPEVVITMPAAAPAEPPRFDVARVGARGMLVAAGRAAPGAEVILYGAGRELGRGRADARGEWVILPTEALQPGARELSLAARSPGRDLVPARETLVLLVPEAASPSAAVAALGGGERGTDGRDAASADRLAGRTTGAATGPLAVLLPQGGAQATPRVLQGAGTGEEPAARQRLGLDAVEYDEAGAMRFAGSAPPGSRVRVYVGQDHAGDAEADAGGRWQLTPVRQPVIGRHTLRVDQVAATGTVAARIEVPFQRDRLPDAAFAAGQVVVQPGQSLWRIARQVYGRGVRYTVIYQANRDQIRDPERIYPGQVFATPGDAAPEQPAALINRSDAPQAASSQSR